MVVLPLFSACHKKAHLRQIHNLIPGKKFDLYTFLDLQLVSLGQKSYKIANFFNTSVHIPGPISFYGFPTRC